jgi:hypothetical protein
LIIDGLKQRQASCGGGIYTFQSNPNRKPLKLRVVLSHLAVEHEGEVRVQLLLKLKQLQLGVIPKTVFLNDEKHLPFGSVHGKAVDAGRVFDSLHVLGVASERGEDLERGVRSFVHLAILGRFGGMQRGASLFLKNQ